MINRDKPSSNRGTTGRLVQICIGWSFTPWLHRYDPRFKPWRHWQYHRIYIWDWHLQNNERNLHGSPRSTGGGGGGGENPGSSRFAKELLGTGQWSPRFRHVVTTFLHGCPRIDVPVWSDLWTRTVGHYFNRKYRKIVSDIIYHCNYQLAVIISNRMKHSRFVANDTSHNVIFIAKQLVQGGVEPGKIACHLEGLLTPLTVAPLELGRAKSVCALIW